MIDLIFYILESIGILSFALSGILIGKQKDYDLVGIFVVACATAFGGGTIRDIILDIQPVYWISHSEYPLIILCMTIIMTYIYPIKVKNNWLFFPDSVGLALFSITASKLAFSLGFPLIIVSILATISATFGGVIRDILCNEKPIIFQKNTSLYATVSFTGSTLYVLLNIYTTIPEHFILIIAVLFTLIFRLISYKYKWKIK